MRPPFQERMQDYVLGPPRAGTPLQPNQDARLAVIAPGQIIQGLALPLDPDAPFALRGRAVRQQADLVNFDQAGLNFFNMRYTGPRGNYLQQSRIPQLAEINYWFGQNGNPHPVFPELIYPANGSITVDIENTGVTPILNLSLYFRGVKLFPWGMVQNYNYPAKLTTFDYTFPIQVANLNAAAVDIRRDQIFAPPPPGDFVLRCGLANFQVPGGGPAPEVFFRLKDESHKPFSNDWVHVDVLFGGTVGPWGIVPTWAPGLFPPEIYVPKNHLLYYDVMRDDTAFIGLNPEDLNFTFRGGKVYPQ